MDAVEFKARAAGAQVGARLFEAAQKQFGAVDLRDPAVLDAILGQLDADLTAQAESLAVNGPAWVAYWRESAVGEFSPRLKMHANLARAADR